MAERKILYYRFSSEDSNLNRWTFLIINEKSQIKLICQKIYAQFQPSQQISIDHGDICESDLSYDLFYLLTPQSRINLPVIYQGKTSWDRRLVPRKTRNGWNDFID